jgi:hypothetical protein
MVDNQSGAAFQTLKRFLDRKPRRTAGESCELCSVEVPSDHGHVVDTHTRSIVCVCRACYLLFTTAGAAGGRYRSIPDRYIAGDSPMMTAAQWNALQIPVGVAFFFHNSPLQRTVAFYPSPAGATESELPLEVWGDIVAASSLVRSLQPDVEALLVRKSDAIETYIVPIDACYELVGRLRRHWKGFDGGDEARSELAQFFDRLRARSRTPTLAATGAE